MYERSGIQPPFTHCSLAMTAPSIIEEPLMLMMHPLWGGRKPPQNRRFVLPSNETEKHDNNAEGMSGPRSWLPGWSRGVPEGSLEHVLLLPNAGFQTLLKGGTPRKGFPDPSRPLGLGRPTKLELHSQTLFRRKKRLMGPDWKEGFPPQSHPTRSRMILRMERAEVQETLHGLGAGWV